MWSDDLESARLYRKQPLAVLHWLAILDVGADDLTFVFRRDLVHQLHRLDDAQNLILFDALTDFDKQVDALRQILGAKKIMSVDELRRGIESIPETDYHKLSYYRRWIRSITDTLLRKGVITEAELRAALEAK